MLRPFALILSLTIACGVFAQEPAVDDSRITEAVAMVDAGKYDDAIAILARTGGPDEARTLAKQYVSTNPGHASGHLLAGKVFEAQDFRVPALFSYMRFLALEPSSPRSADASARLQNLMNTAGMQEAEGKVGYPKSRKEEGDFAPVEFALWFASHELTSGLTVDATGATDFQKAVYVLSELIMMDAMELRSKEFKAAPPNFTSTVQRPFFSDLNRRSLVVPYAGLALSSLNLSGTDAWMKKNTRAVERYQKWVQSQAAKPPAKPRP
jgi:hypothetical protein